MGLKGKHDLETREESRNRVKNNDRVRARVFKGKQNIKSPCDNIKIVK